MPPHQDPIKELLDLESRRPQEPFLDRPRRPNNYRYMPEYKDWQAAIQEHERELTRWYQANLLISSPGPGQVEVKLAGRRLPGCSFSITAAGYARIEPDFAKVLYPKAKSLPDYWTKPLEIPGRSQNLETFLKDNKGRDNQGRRWDLETPITQLEQNLPGIEHRLPGRELRSVHWRIQEALEAFVGQVRDLLNPEPLRFLNRLNGGAPGKPWTLLDYNLAVHSREVLAKTAATNPGAVAIWLYMWQEQTLFPAPPGGRSPYRDELPFSPPQFPTHPAEIIKLVKEWFDAEAQTPCWKSLAGQPAEHIKRQLRRQRNTRSQLYGGPSNWQLALWTAERLRQSNLKGQAPPKHSKPVPADLPPSRLTPPEPPLPLKLLLAEIRFARIAPGTRRDQRRRDLGMPAESPATDAPQADQEQVEQALDHLVEMALRQYAGAKNRFAAADQRKRLQSHLQDISDYCWSQPAQALQSKTLPGLAKASERWHQDYILRQIAAELAAVEAQIAQAAAENSSAEWTQEWPCLLPEYQEPHWQARYLPNAHELLQESITMGHCVGDRLYRRDCAAGHTRIFHLQPRPPGAAADWQPNLAQARQEGSTVELYCLNLENAAPRWTVRQHRCFKNALPAPAAIDFADRLAAALTRASLQSQP